MSGDLRVIPVRGIPEVTPGDDLAALIAAATTVCDGDVVVVAQKVVSKAEGALADAAAGEDVDAARVRLAREQAVRVVADVPPTLIVRTLHGLVCANAGVDASNVPGGRLTLLPANPDASARRLRAGLRVSAGVDVAVIVADTFGRPWRLGQTDVAIGVAGLVPVRDDRGRVDRQGVSLRASVAAVADELAGVADLVRGKAEGIPAVLVRGYAGPRDDTATAATLVRPESEDLFPRGRGMLGTALIDADGLTGPVSASDLAGVTDPAWPGWPPGVRLTARSGAGATTVVVRGGRAAARGAAAALLAARLVDMGYSARMRLGGRRATVRAGRRA